jgi:hypothetical protein
MLTSQHNAPGGIQSIDTLVKIVSGGQTAFSIRSSQLSDTRSGVTICSSRSDVQLGFFSFQPSSMSRPARSGS